MSRAAPDWPAQQTRALIAGKYETLFGQCKAVFGEARAYRVILRSVLGKAEETDGAFEEPRHG
ncbi:MAG: hypothetical protein E6Q97_06310 [Desulfurellales bacterium]|nr:MAG: hypothetical protein E6Q97_06310 [Desulfurellales bacterium]